MDFKEKNKLGLRTAVISSLFNVMAAIGKIIFGILGNSYALIADGIESTLDIISSLLVWGGLKIAAEPPDIKHPYGHGKAESLAGVIVSIILIATGIGIGYNGIHRIFSENIEIPKFFTIYVFLTVIIIKEALYHYVLNIANKIRSTSMIAEAWHHRSDALTTIMALTGVLIAIYFNYPKADGIAAILCAVIIIFNGVRILWLSANEVMDTVAPESYYDKIKNKTLEHKKIKNLSNCRIRKNGLNYLLDVSIQVEPNITVMEGHKIAHELEEMLLTDKSLHLTDIIVHIEPYESVATSY